MRLFLLDFDSWIKQTYRKIMHAQNHITGNDLVKIDPSTISVVFLLLVLRQLSCDNVCL